MQNGEKIGQIPDHRLSTSETSFRQNLLIKRYNTSTTDIITISKLYPRLLSQSELDQKEQDFQEYGQDIPGFIASEFIIHDPRILLLTSEKLKKQEEPRLRTIGITDPHRAIVRNPHLPFIPNKKFELFYHQVKRIGIPNGICMINADPRAIDYKPKIYKQGIYTLVNYKEHAKNRQDDIFSLTDAQWIIGSCPYVAFYIINNSNNTAENYNILRQIINTLTENKIQHPIPLLTKNPDLFTHFSRLSNIIDHFYSPEEKKMVAGILETHPEIINMKSPEALIEIKKLFHFQIAVNQSVSKPVLELKPILSSESLAQLPKPRELFLSTNNPEPSTNARSTTLTDRQQTIINLFKDGMSILEISHQLKITPSAVYQNITTLRGKGFLPPKQLKSHSEPELIYRSTKTQQKILTIYQTYKDITGNFPIIEYLIQETGLSKSYIYSCISNIRNKIPGLKLEKKPNCQVKKSENQNLGLTPKQQKILTLYQELTQQNHGFPPSIEKLEEKTGYKKSTIYRYLHIFETKKLIIRETKISPKTELTFKQQNFLTIYQKKTKENHGIPPSTEQMAEILKIGKNAVEHYFGILRAKGLISELPNAQEKIFNILKQNNGNPLSIDQLTQQSGYGKPTIYRCLRGLETKGMLAYQIIEPKS